MDHDGIKYKMQIKVQISSNGYGWTEIRVVEKYVNTGLGGQWQKIYSGSSASKCTSYASQNPLEKQFMYKAIIDTNTWYFDL